MEQVCVICRFYLKQMIFLITAKNNREVRLFNVNPVGAEALCSSKFLLWMEKTGCSTCPRLRVLVGWSLLQRRLKGEGKRLCVCLCMCL